MPSITDIGMTWPPPPEAATCANCAFFRQGACHRQPPTPVMTDEGVSGFWPETGRKDWCGEWRRMSEATA